MTTQFYASEKRIRRFLRDPDAGIWDTDQLIAFFNEAQIEVQQKGSLLEYVETYRYPPAYTWSYMFDFEREYTEGDRYQCLVQLQPYDGMVITFPWEAAYWMTASNTPDDGLRFTHPWEAGHCNPADVVPMPCDAQFNEAKFAAFDKERIEPTTQRELAMQDRYYRTHSGQVLKYYRPDEYRNQVVLYPRPGAVVFQDPPDEEQVFNEDGTGVWLDFDGYSGAAYTCTFEGALLNPVVLTAGSFGTKVTETVEGDNTTDGLRYECSFPWEASHVKGEVYQETLGGIVTSDEDHLDESHLGLVTDDIDADDALLMVFEPIPMDIESPTDELEWPDWAVKYVEYGTLERAYGADTDGFIPSLRDYWRLRKEIGIEALKKLKRSKLKDRDFVMGQKPAFGRSRLRLPSGYPAVWP